MSSGDEEAPPPKPTGGRGIMTRFLKDSGAGGGDSSSSSSSSDEDSDEDSDDEDGEGGSGGSDEERTVVKSAAQKRLDEMVATGKVMDNGLKINDWVAISNGMLHAKTIK